jgi:photosystem II stability/assembly factor-like uncharacterized protein
MKILRILTALLLAAGIAAADPAGAPRYDNWKIIGPGGGGGQFNPTISPHGANDVLISCDMTGSYLSQDGGDTWRMFNLRGVARFYVFDPGDPNVIYVQTLGLWRTTNRGRTWALVHPDPATIEGVQMPDDHAGERIVFSGEPKGSIMALAVDPGNSKVLYAVFRDGQSDALFISRNWGRSWTKSADLPGGGRKIYVDPHSRLTDRAVYVVGNNSIAARLKGRWRTGQAPGGMQTFVDVTAGFPQGGGSLVAYAISNRDIFVSEDGGESWVKCDFPAAVRAIAASLNHPDVAYVSYSRPRPEGDGSYGVAKTADRGRTWELVWRDLDTPAPNVFDSWITEYFGRGWAGNPLSVGAAPNDPDICYGGDYGRTVRTSDGGKTWKGVYSVRLEDGSYTTSGLDVTTNYGVHADPFDARRVFITYTDIGLFRSENGGESWLKSTAGVPQAWVNTTYWMEFDPEVNGRVWGVMSGIHDLPRPKMWRSRPVSGYNGGACRSDDGARTWNCSNNLPQTAATHILLDPASPANSRTLYAAGFGRGVFKSTDGGSRWTLKNNGIEGSEPFAWRFTRDRDGVLYLVVARRTEDGSVGAGDGALYRSTDGAESWSRIPLPWGLNGPNGLAVDPRDTNRMYLAAWGRRTPTTAMDGGIFLSEDGGANWRNVLSEDQHIYDVTIDPRNPDTLYACGFSSSAWRSDDRGETWRRLKGYNFKWGHRVVPDPSDPSMIYVTTFGGSVWHGPAEGDPTAPEDISTPVLGWK